MSKDLVSPQELLGPEEQKALERFKEEGAYALSPTLASSFFSLFLQGKTLKEIHEMNRAIPFGAIVDARVRYGWDAARDQYVFELQSGIVRRMIQTQMESANFLADVMAATHKKHGTAIKKYLQTGNEDDLQGFNIESITSYGKLIESIMKITGKDKEKPAAKSDSLPPMGSASGQPVGPSSSQIKGVSPTQAAKILRILASGEVKPENVE